MQKIRENSKIIFYLLDILTFIIFLFTDFYDFDKSKGNENWQNSIFKSLDSIVCYLQALKMRRRKTPTKSDDLSTESNKKVVSWTSRISAPTQLLLIKKVKEIELSQI